MQNKCNGDAEEEEVWEDNLYIWGELSNLKLSC